MSRLTISMPEQMNQWVNAQIVAGPHHSVTEYFRDLVRRDQERREAAIGALRTVLAQAEASGITDDLSQKCCSPRATRRGNKASCVTRIELARAAECDLADIYLYDVAQFGAAQADRYAAAPAAKTGLVAENQSFGSDYSFVRHGLHRCECIPQAIYDCPSDPGILVLRILHSRMDRGQHLA